MGAAHIYTYTSVPDTALHTINVTIPIINSRATLMLVYLMPIYQVRNPYIILIYAATPDNIPLHSYTSQLDHIFVKPGTD